MSQFQVAVKTHNDAHFALSTSPHDSAEMIEIVLGGRQNTRSWISRGKMGEPLVSASTPGILSWDEFRSFWISWKADMVQVRTNRGVLDLALSADCSPVSGNMSFFTKGSSEMIICLPRGNVLYVCLFLCL